MFDLCGDSNGRVLEMTETYFRYRDVRFEELMVPGTIVVVKDRTYLFTKAGVWVDDDAHIHPRYVFYPSFAGGAVQIIRRGSFD